MAPRECPTASACPAQPGMGIIPFSWRKTEEILPPPLCPPQAAIHYPFSLKILLHLDIFMLISDRGSTGRSEEEKGKETPNNHGWWLRSAAEPRHCSGILDSAPPPLSSAVTFRPSGASQPAGRWGLLPGEHTDCPWRCGDLQGALWSAGVQPLPSRTRLSPSPLPVPTPWGQELSFSFILCWGSYSCPAIPQRACWSSLALR